MTSHGSGQWDGVMQVDFDEKRSSAQHLDYIEDPELERIITRKCDVHILPWLFLLWLLAFIDRSNIGNANIQGLPEDIGLVGNQFNVALAVFYIIYILIDIPSNWLLKIVGGGRYIPILACAFGIVGTCQGAVTSFGGLVACRLLLGACEGGLFGGLILYLSLWYKRHSLMLRFACFYCAAPLSGAFGGLLATGLAQISYHGYNGWPWIFFVEGSITVVAGIVAFFFLPNTPSSAKFLTEHEQYVAAHRLRVDMQGGTSKDKSEDEEFSWKAVRLALLNINTLLMSWTFFLILVPIYSYSLFLPTIIEAFGYSTIVSQLFTVPPNFLAFLVVLGAAALSDKIQMRGPLIVAGMLLASIGYIMQLAGNTNAVKYAGTFFISVGAFPCSPLICAWLANNLAPTYVKATGLGLIVAIGNCSAFLATFTYLKADAPDYTIGHSINLACALLSAICAGINILYIKKENSMRKAGKRDVRYEQLQAGEELGSRHPKFMYTL